MNTRLFTWSLAVAACLFQGSLLAQDFNASSIRVAFELLSEAPTNHSDNEFRVKLLVPVSTETNKEGDKITAQVLSPRVFEDDFLEGRIRQSKEGGKFKGHSVLSFSFDTLYHHGNSIPVKLVVRSVVNSQGRPDVDEEGNLLRANHGLGKTILATGAGAFIGGLVGGLEGAGIGAGIGATASVVLVQFVAKAPHVSFAPGAKFLLAGE